MRLKGLILFLLFLALGISAELNAQVGYGNGYYGRQRSGIPRTPVEKKEPKPQTAEEIVAEQMPKISEELSLNDFEQAVVSSILTRYVEQRIQLQLLELSPEKMREGLEKIQKNQQAELKAGLPEEKFKALEEYQKNGYRIKKKKKKKRKSKSNN
ncbi:MAG: hypothetical protein KJP14_00485 [Eudoraea sp.]|nr:hypothetical protein [Eudoraea sp.]